MQQLGACVWPFFEQGFHIPFIHRFEFEIRIGYGNDVGQSTITKQWLLLWTYNLERIEVTIFVLQARKQTSTQKR